MSSTDPAMAFGLDDEAASDPAPLQTTSPEDIDAYIEAVHLNVIHGKPLTRVEREQAVLRILERRPELSDRGIAEICGMAPKTVARLRRRNGVDGALVAAKVGRDGRVRPVDPAISRRDAAEVIRRHPNASLRAVARMTGVSAGTVSDVRRRLSHGLGPVPPGIAPRTEQDVSIERGYDWSGDAAIASTSGSTFTKWFERSDISEKNWAEFVATLPLSRVYLVADESRRRAAEWQAFASALTERAQRGGSR